MLEAIAAQVLIGEFVDIGHGFHDRSDSSDVLHRRQLHCGVAIELVDYGGHSLKALCSDWVTLVSSEFGAQGRLESVDWVRMARSPLIGKFECGVSLLAERVVRSENRPSLVDAIP
jgi:hypothetical protein